MTITPMPKKVSFSVEYNNTETLLVYDPKGWENESVALSRQDSFGLNRVMSNELVFVKDDAELLRFIFSQTGYASKAKLNIRSRTNSWEMPIFGTFDIDFSQYKDKVDEGVSIAVDNIDMFALWNTYRGTDYKLEFPTNGSECKFINYNGLKRYVNNLFQLVPWVNPQDHAFDGGAFFTLNYQNTTHEYSSSIEKLNADGLPYTGFFFKAKETCNIKIKLNLDFDIYWKSAGQGGYKSRIYVQLMKAPAGNSNSNYVLREFTDANGGGAWFEHTTRIYYQETFDTTIYKDEYLFMRVYVDGSFLEHIQFTGVNSYVDTDIFGQSPFQDYKIQAVTHEHLIRAIFNKIYDNKYGGTIHPTINYEITFPYADLISSATSIRGYSQDKRFISSSLDAVLESLDKLRCIGLKFDGDTLVVCRREECYPVDYTNAIEIVPTNTLEVKSSSEDVFNSIVAGFDFSADKDVDKNGQFEFNCKQGFTLNTNNVSENKEYNLVLSFITACSKIESYMNEMLDEDSSSSTKDTELFLFACNSNPSGNVENGVYYDLYRSYSTISSKLDANTLSLVSLMYCLSSFPYNEYPK